MFELKKFVARNASTDPDDTASIKFAMTSLGYYDDTETGLSPYGDDQLFHAVQDFQRDNDLEADGMINPNGPTQEKINTRLKNDPKAGNAFIDFVRNRMDMVRANTIGSDKYFHCKANYEATERGWFNSLAARVLSDTKELRDQYYEGYSKRDIDEDQEANEHGREAAKSGKYDSAKAACAIYRPKELDGKY